LSSDCLHLLLVKCSQTFTLYSIVCVLVVTLKDEDLINMNEAVVAVDPTAGSSQQPSALRLLSLGMQFSILEIARLTLVFCIRWWWHQRHLGTGHIRRDHASSPAS